MSNSDSQYLACELIKSFHKSDAILSEILKEEEPSVIDIGCGGYPYNLYILYHDFQFKKLIGIEMESEVDAFNTFLEKNCEEIDKNKFKNRFEFYRHDVKVEPHDQPLLGETDYYNMFDIKFKTKAQDYFRKLPEKTFFDCLILSNILHYFKPYERGQFFKMVTRTIKSGGILYLRMNDYATPSAEKNFKNLLIEYKELFYQKIKHNKLDNTDSLIYLGVKS